MMKKMLFPFNGEFLLKRNRGNTKYHQPIKGLKLPPSGTKFVFSLSLSLSLSLSMPGTSAMNESEKRDERGEAGPSSVSCTVCLDAVTIDAGDRGVATLACGHRFHLGRCFLILLEKHTLFLVFLDSPAPSAMTRFDRRG